MPPEPKPQSIMQKSKSSFSRAGKSGETKGCCIEGCHAHAPLQKNKNVPAKGRGTTQARPTLNDPPLKSMIRQLQPILFLPLFVLGGGATVGGGEPTPNNSLRSLSPSPRRTEVEAGPPTASVAIGRPRPVTSQGGKAKGLVWR